MLTNFTNLPSRYRLFLNIYRLVSAGISYRLDFLEGKKMSRSSVCIEKVTSRASHKLQCSRLYYFATILFASLGNPDLKWHYFD